MTKAQAIDRLLHLWGEMHDVNVASALLEWDQETYMPPKGAPARARQLASLAGIAHEKLTSAEIGHLLDQLRGLSGSLSAIESALVREASRDHERALKLPGDLVREIAKVQSEALHVWSEARMASRFDQFAPHLERLIGLKRQVAECLGYAEVPYDALIDEFEPGATTRKVSSLVDRLKPELVKLLREIQASRVSIDTSCVMGDFPESAQTEFALEIAQAMGFDLEAGRLDCSTHPFCTAFHPTDVRLTTRFGDHDLRPALFGVVHEAGHGLYEQGLNQEWSRGPLGHPASLGVHESQSRLWENLIARSLPFWRHFFPRLKARFGKAFERTPLETFYAAINRVEPSFIRVEADEVTYNLHIVLRFDLERRLFSGELPVADLPAAWNQETRELLGITPSRDKEGVLQDIHWAMGAFGYFPTYTLGNLYSAQLHARATQDIPDLEEKIGRGELLPLRDWLREHVHRPGRLYPPDELIQRATGKPPGPDAFVSYLRGKFGALYRL